MNELYLLTEAKKANFLWKLVNHDMDHLLEYPYVPQKTWHSPSIQTTLPYADSECIETASQSIVNFYEGLSNGDFCPHSAIILKDGNVLSSAEWKPYSASTRHITNSLCKSVVAMAIGLAEAEGLIALHEKITDIFSEKTSILTSRRMREVTVFHLLTMTSGARFFEADTVLASDWTKGFLNSDVKFNPGEQFEYNSLNTYMLCAALCRKTGVSVVEYLTPRLFEPLQIQRVFWEKCPLGIEKGGWGCYLTVEEAAKLGLLYLNEGVFNGKRILPAKWIASCTTPQKIETNREWQYGFQIWIVEQLGGYMFHGMFGQYVLVLPKQQMVIALTGGCNSVFASAELIALVKQCFINRALPTANQQSLTALKKLESDMQIKSIAMAYPKKSAWYRNAMNFIGVSDKDKLPAQCASLCKVIYTAKAATTGILPIFVQCMQSNYSQGITAISFSIRNECFFIGIEDAGKTYLLPVGFTDYNHTSIQLGGETYLIAAKGVFTTDEDDDMVLKLTLCFTELASVRHIKLFFKGERLILKMEETPCVHEVLKEMFAQHQDKIPQGIKGTIENQAEPLDFLLAQTLNPVICLEKWSDDNGTK